MRKFLGVLAITAIPTFVPMALVYAIDPIPILDEGSPRSASAPHLVTGVLLKIEGDVYVVKEKTGREVLLQVDKRTTMIGNIKRGDSIEAQVSEDGRATSIRQVRG